MRMWLLVTAVAWASPAWGQVTGEIIQFGETSVHRTGEAPVSGPTRSLGQVMPIADVTYLNGSDHIEAALCRHFGATIRLTGPGGVVPQRLQVRVRHGQMTREDGATLSVEEFPTLVHDGESYSGFTFDAPYEMVAGEWEIGFYFKGALLAAKRFEVTVAAGPPASVCEKPLS